MGRLECLNVLRNYPGPEGDKGDAFPRQKAQRAARRLWRSLRGCTVLLAGKRVGRAFGIRHNYLVWTTHEAGFDVVVTRKLR